jgi:protein-tyrosine-phosphatase
MEATIPIERFVEIANLSIPMLRNAVLAFVQQDSDLARKSMADEEVVDTLKSKLNADLIQLRHDNKIPLQALHPLMTIARRFERVSDQAKNICEETVYMCTGEYAKHKGTEVFRVLFVDEHNSCRSLMAEGIGQALGRPQFIFSSAGLDPKPADPATVSFLKAKGIDLSRHIPKTLQQIPNLDHYHIVVGLAQEAQKALPPPPRKTVYFDWNVEDPSKTEGSPAVVRAAYERTYEFLLSQIQDLAEALLGNNSD